MPRCPSSILLLPVSYPGSLVPRAMMHQTIFRVFYNHSARTTENNSPVLLAAFVLRTLPSNGSMRHNVISYTRAGLDCEICGM
jgi:hypothetical protein